ncbi:MAG: serine/threonine protein kinase [Acidobacteria bacterium]|jgi:serine/threonine protein kinase|nr:MAG: serine/threonine protein kinase [Acidobacteriota bacterium]
MVSHEEKKLNCPKCGTTYEEEWRFCLKDNSRLFPGSQEKATRIQNILAEVQKHKANRLRESEKTSAEEIETPIETFLEEVLVWKKGKTLIQVKPSELFMDSSDEERQEETRVKLVNPFTIPSGTVEPGDRSVKPLGREAFNPEKPRLMLGKTLKGRYEILNFVKRTLKFCVYSANDLVAEKNGLEKKTLVYIFTQKDDNAIRKILGEERVAFSHTKHPNIAVMIDSGRLQEGNPFMVLESPEGESLEKRISEKGYMEVSRVARIIYQAAEALGEAHRNGVLHRNLTPQKIILSFNDKGVEQVKVMEFAVSEGEVTQENFLYLAPEQLEGKSVSPNSDIFSLGVIAYQLLTKRLPFEASSIEALQRLHKQGLKLKPSQLRIDVPFVVDEVLRKALAFEPSQRYLRARDFGDAFYNALVKTVEEEKISTTTTTKEKPHKEELQKPFKDKTEPMKTTAQKSPALSKAGSDAKVHEKSSRISKKNLLFLFLLILALLAILYFVFTEL